MAPVPRTALRFAFRPDLLVLYAVLFVGMELAASPHLLPGFYRPIDRVLRTVVSIGAFALIAGSLVAILHTVVRDANRP